MTGPNIYPPGSCAKSHTSSAPCSQVSLLAGTIFLFCSNQPLDVTHGWSSLSLQKLVSHLALPSLPLLSIPQPETISTTLHRAALAGGSWNKSAETSPHKLLLPPPLALRMSSSPPELSQLFTFLQPPCPKSPQQFQAHFADHTGNIG